MRAATFSIALMLLLASGCQGERDTTADNITSAPQPDSFAPLASIQKASITLPEDAETFGEGEHAALLNRTCLACHSTSMIRYQPPLDRKTWTAEVTKMREAYGAPFAKEETGAIVEALMATQPSKKD